MPSPKSVCRFAERAGCIRRLEFLHLARVRASRGAGAFACQPRARPRPGAWIRCQSSAHRVVLYIASDTVQFDFIPHTMVEGFILPESLSRSAQDQVGLSRAGAFQPARDHRQGGRGPQQYMHMIGHDHPGSELIKVPSALAIQESIGYHARHSGIPQPNRSESSFVRFAVQGEEGPAGGQRRTSRRLRQSSPRDGTGQTPSNEQEGLFSDIGMPVGQLSAVEHNGLAGESACPTYSAWTGGKSRKNVETPGAGHAQPVSRGGKGLSLLRQDAS